MTGRRSRIRQAPQQSESTHAPPPEHPRVFEDADEIEVKQTYTNTCIFCMDSETDSTTDETTYEYIPQSYQKQIIKYSVDL